MTRGQKVKVAQQLRSQGLRLREIAERMGVSVSTAGSWLEDPDLSKQRARRKRYERPCPQCGKPMDGSNGYNGHRQSVLCQQCRLEQPHSVQASVQHAANLARVNGKRFSDEELLAALRQVGSGGVKHYREVSPGLGLPTAATIMHRFGTWNEAKRRAGLPTTPALRSSYSHLTLEGMRAALRLAERFLGEIPSSIAYERLRGERPDLGLPCLATVRIYWTWSEALTLTFAESEQAAA